MVDHVFTGFGFGPIQAGLFVSEAFSSGNFRRIVIAEIVDELVEAVRANGGSYYVNVAATDGVKVMQVDNVELINPKTDREKLVAVLGESTEIVTSLPSVDFYSAGGDNSVAALISQGLSASSAKGSIIYAAENNNHAAEVLCEVVKPGDNKNVQFLNTVIGKMSRVVTDAAEIAELKLKPIAPGIDRAFLVEEFNKILVTKCALAGFSPGIEVFIEKQDLLPFEEAKLYGHNAIHALLAYLGIAKRYEKMTDMKDDSALMTIARNAFLNESGGALIKKNAHLNDELFTRAGFKEYTDDLLERMTNPYLQDTTDRAGRDPVRKLGIGDRIFGTMNLAIDQGIEPANMACAAAAGVRYLLNNTQEYNVPENLSGIDVQRPSADNIRDILLWLWSRADQKEQQHSAEIIELTRRAYLKLPELL